MDLTQTWKQAEEYISMGLFMFAIRDKDKGGKLAKSPFETGWQLQRNNTIELYNKLAKFDTTGIGVICGKASGGLHVIDVDTKFLSGFDAVLFSDLSNIYPQIWNRLRVHKTPSGGYHLLYRIEGDIIPGNKKLAGIAATETQLLTSSTKEYHFIETRGEGGFIAVSPSMGYEVIQDRPIPVLTWNEHSSIIELCKSYTKLIKVEKAIKVSKADNDFYSTNPWADFNASPDAEMILQQNGWKFSHENAVYKYFTRPDKQAGISASYHKEWRKYWIWTSSSELETAHYKHPGTILKELQFGGDGSKTYAHLISRGFGKIKPHQERKLAQNRATFGGALPPNASDEAKKIFEETRNKLNDKYPHGIFWEEEDGKYTISRERLYIVSELMGFRQHNKIICRIDGYKIIVSSDTEYINNLKAYIQEEDAEIYEDLCNCFEQFIQHNGKYTLSRLSELDTSMVLESTRHISFKFYNNCIVRVTAARIDTFSYDELKGRFIFAKHIQPRDFEIGEYEDTLYHEFLKLAPTFNEHTLRCIGYYAHDYKSTDAAWIVFLCEMNEDYRHGGRSGKNAFTNLLNFTNTVKDKMGENLKIDDTLLRTWDGERILSINDLPKNFPLLQLRELASGTWEVGKKYVQEVTVKNKALPKIILNSNFSFDHNQPGLKGRIIPLEFTNFFHSGYGIRKHFGLSFPTDSTSLGDWSRKDWIGYDNIIMLAIQEYIKADCILDCPPLTSTGWIKQFKQTFYQQTYEFIKENIESWQGIPGVKTEDFNATYATFCRENNIQHRNVLTSFQLNNALEEYCKHYGIYFEKNGLYKANGFQYRGRVFRDGSGKLENNNINDVPF